MQPKIVIATPIFGGAYGRYVASLAKTLHELGKRGIPHDYLVIDGDAYIHQARNTLALSFLSGDGDVLFFIDQDMGWSPEGFFRVALADKPVVAAAYPMKNNWGQWTAKIVEKDGFLSGTARGDGDGYLVEAETVPMGFTRITRDALMVMREKRPECDFPSPFSADRKFHRWFDTPYGERGVIGEDVWFSTEWRRIGGQLWIEPNVTLAHIGQKAWEGNLHRALSEQMAEPEQVVGDSGVPF